MSCDPVDGMVLTYETETGRVHVATSAKRYDCCVIELELTRDDPLFGQSLVEKGILHCYGPGYTFRHADFNSGVKYYVAAVVQCKDCTLSDPTTGFVTVP